MKLDTEKCKEIMAAQGISGYSMAASMGVSHQWVYFLLGGTGQVTFPTVERIASVLGVPGKDLISE